MPNIVVYSDGTGRRGGRLFDERRSNVYKLFRATRCGPDSSVHPAEQPTFYDPRLGTAPSGHEGSGPIATAARGFYNLVSQATGLGIMRHIIDCSNFLIEAGVRRLCKRIRGADRVRRTCDHLVSRDIYAPAAARSVSVIIGRIVAADFGWCGRLPWRRYSAGHSSAVP
jgi:hypothetical protein